MKASAALPTILVRPMNTNSSAPGSPAPAGSLLRGFVEDAIGTNVGATGEWSWEPDVVLDRSLLANVSPTTEYESE